MSSNGNNHYLAHCAACHQPDGRGIESLHPSLIQTRWVLGDKQTLINIVLNGLKGPINVHGQIYNDVMPGFSHLSDSDIGAILSHVRQSFGNNASAVTAEDVAVVRSGKTLNPAHDLSTVKAETDYKGRKALQKNRVQSRIGSVFERGELHMNMLRMPEGFSIRVFASGLKNPRSLALTKAGTLIVGTRRNSEDFVYVIKDADKLDSTDNVQKLKKGLRWRPMGVAVKGDDLYVGEIDRILKFPNIDRQIKNGVGNVAEPIVIFRYPKEQKHGDKYIRFGPDKKLYVPVGAPCNSCLEANPVFSSITRINDDGSDFEVFAHGVRNSRGYDWHPETGQMWFSDNGRDLMGDDIPPCEINIAQKPGGHFGFPYCHGSDIPDPEFGNEKSCEQFTPTTYDLPAHVAPVSLKFYTGIQFPEEYRNAMFISEHGSWNRTRKQGYRVSMLKVEGNKVTSYMPFIEGWLNEHTNDAWGRPADILQMPDGSLLLSDDYAGVIYKISYK